MKSNVANYLKTHHNFRYATILSIHTHTYMHLEKRIEKNTAKYKAGRMWYCD